MSDEPIQPAPPVETDQPEALFEEGPFTPSLSQPNRVGVRIEQLVPELIQDYIQMHGQPNPLDPPPRPLIVHAHRDDSMAYITHRDDLGFATGEYIEIEYSSIDDLIIALLTIKKSMLPDGVDLDDLHDDWDDLPPPSNPNPTEEAAS